MEGTSAEPLPDRGTDTEKAVNLIVQGRRNIICGEIPLAVQQFQDACQLLSKHYGEMAKECAEAYFCYGKSLLDLARTDNGVFGEGIPEERAEGEEDENDDDDEEGGDEEEQMETEAEEKKDGDEKTDEQNGDSAKPGEDKTTEENKDDKEPDTTETEVKPETDEKKSETTTSGTTESDAKTEDKDGEADKPTGTAESSGEKSEEKKDEENGDEKADGEDNPDDCAEDENGDENAEEEEDVSNLQLAWEMLELAKMIYLKGESKAEQLAAAQCHLKLGEVSLETEQYEQAISDLKDCLRLQESHLEPDDRLLAESHYQLGLAHGLAKQFENSITHYRTAVKTITARIDRLKESIKDGESNKENGNIDVGAIEQEIKDLEEILPDINSKIDETEEDKRGVDHLKELAKDAFCEQLPENKNSTKIGDSVLEGKDKTVSDISHLIRKKRKPEEDAETDQEPKKSKQENGDCVVPPSVDATGDAKN